MEKNCENCFYKGWNEGCYLTKIGVKCKEEGYKYFAQECSNCGNIAEYLYNGEPICLDCLLMKEKIETNEVVIYYDEDGIELGTSEDFDKAEEQLINNSEANIKRID